VYATAGAAITAGIAKSTKNDTTHIASPAELLGIVRLSMARMFGAALDTNGWPLAARVNGTLVQGSMAMNADWMGVLRFEHATTRAKINVVPPDDKDMFKGTKAPVLLNYGHAFIDAGEGAIASPFAVWAVTTPDAIADVTSLIDPRIPNAFRECIAADVALHCAIKDGRTEEFEGLIAERDGWLTLFREHLKRQPAYETRRTGHATMVPRRSPKPAGEG
jgi:hypothetical protein